MKSYTTFVLLVWCSQVAFSQNSEIKRTWHWDFGYTAGIDFSSGIAITDTSSVINSPEGTSSISDTLGNLLFYSDGLTIWNRFHQPMPNGSGLNGGENKSSVQQVLIVPQPFSDHIFYVFTTDEQENFGAKGMCYSIVDLNLDGGLGDVTTTKNISLFTPCTEKLSAVNHCSDSAVWIIGHEAGNNNFMAYLLSTTGLNINPVISSIGMSLDTSQGIFALGGPIKFTSNGKKMATTTNNRNNVELYDFDSFTGQISNRIILTSQDSLVYGLEFSFDNQKLYESTTKGYLYQYDISLNDSEAILNSKSLIYFDNGLYGFGQLQKAADGRIYVGTRTVTQYVSVINNPNATGYNCNFVDTSLDLHGNFNLFIHLCGLGLPNFNASYFLDGSKAECITGIENLRDNDLKIFPNPAHDWIEIEGEQIISIQLIDCITGQLIEHVDYPPENIRLAVSHTARGILFIRIITESGIGWKKIILQ